MKPQYIDNQGMQIGNNFWQVHPKTCEPWTEQSITEFIESYQEDANEPDIESLKQVAINKIKREAAERIVALDWQLERAEERLSEAELCNPGALEQAEDALLEILDARDLIRQQSNLAEEQLKALEDTDAIVNFSW